MFHLTVLVLNKHRSVFFVWKLGDPIINKNVSLNTLFLHYTWLKHELHILLERKPDPILKCSPTQFIVVFKIGIEHCCVLPKTRWSAVIFICTSNNNSIFISIFSQNRSHSLKYYRTLAILCAFKTKRNCMDTTFEKDEFTLTECSIVCMAGAGHNGSSCRALGDPDGTIRSDAYGPHRVHVCLTPIHRQTSVQRDYIWRISL